MRYFIGYMVTIGLLIVLILFLATSGGGKHKTTTKPATLNSYAATDAAVSVSIDGPITAPQTHSQIIITVNAFEANYTQLQGYDGSVVKTQSFPNTQNSYYAFLSALMQAGFTHGISSTISDTGLCPLGQRYDIRMTQDGQSLQHYWITSCGGISTYRGSLGLTLTLFKAQIPNYSLLSSNARL